MFDSLITSLEAQQAASRDIATGGGDYAERDVDKRSGTFVERDQITMPSQVGGGVTLFTGAASGVFFNGIINLYQEQLAAPEATMQPRCAAISMISTRGTRPSTCAASTIAHSTCRSASCMCRCACTSPRPRN